MRLYHTGFSEIRVPDVRHGRRNADFGQGFYLSPDLAFSRRWARTRAGQDTWLNAYELPLDGLTVHTFARDEAWFRYLRGNRNGRADALGADVVVGPIANDTIFDLLGVTTSGYLTDSQALRLLCMGPEYTQVALKTERAAAALRFLSAEVIAPEEVAASREALLREQEAYQAEAAKLLRELLRE